MIPDARRAEFPPGPRRRPRFPVDVWVRIGGAWCPGHVHAWVRVGDGWVMWTQFKTQPVPWPQWEWFAYDEVSVRQREGEQPPPD